MEDVHRLCARLLDDLGVTLSVTDDLKAVKDDLATQLKAPDKMRWVTAVEALRKAVEPKLNEIVPGLLKGLPKVQLGQDVDVQEADEGVLRNVADMSTGVVVAGADMPFSCKALLDVRGAWVVESLPIPAGVEAYLRTVDFTLTISIEGNATPVHTTHEIKSFVVESVLADSISWGDAAREDRRFEPPLQLLSSAVYVDRP